MTQQPNKNWFGRNWFWVVLVGCLSMAVAAVGFIAILVMLVFGVMKSSDVYQDAVARAKASPAVQAALGTPIEEGYLVTGDINVSGASGEANLIVPLSGPKGNGNVFLNATKSAGTWNFSSLVFESGGEELDLLAEGNTF